uniref:Uncharacterized protein n=1 Tax=Oryza brachyantha TaxID=4533 RepID=J3KV71_ORYBR
MAYLVFSHRMFALSWCILFAQGHDPFVSYEGLDQPHRFLFILGITHLLYTSVTVVLSMIKIYSWREFENQACQLPTEQLQGQAVN